MKNEKKKRYDKKKTKDERNEKYSGSKDIKKGKTKLGKM